MRALLLALLLLLATTATGFAACQGPEGLPSPGSAPDAHPGDFRFAPGRGLGCVVAEEHALEMARGEEPLTFLGCLRIGVVAVSEDVDDVEDKLGAADRAMPLSEGVEVRSYPVPQRSEERPHYLVTYRLGKVVAVQLAGPPTVMPVAFSGIVLGDGKQRVVDVLGPPSRRCDTRQGGESWTWNPFPVGIDFRDGRVVAMKVTWPRR